MLGGAEAKLRADPELAARVELVRGQAESLPFATGEFDHLTFTYLLRYVEDLATTLGELARVVPGGASPPSSSCGHRIRRRVHSGASTGASACPLSAACSRATGMRSGGSWSQVISGFYRRLPLERWFPARGGN